MKMPTVMGPQHKFSMVPSTDMERSVFDRSHAVKLTFNAGLLVPVFVDEVLPGDTFHLNMTAFARLSTPIKPVMDNMYLDSFFFFVPYRLVWANFVKMMGEQTNPGDSISFTVPQATGPTNGYAIGSVGDYFGLPTVGQVGAGNHVDASALPFRAYALIYNQWFRDENLINSLAAPVTDGPDTGWQTVTPYKRGKRHDYFTSCLPFLQKGTAVPIPFSGLASVVPTTAHAQPTFWNVTAATNAGGLLRSAAGAGTAINIQNAGNGAGEGLGWNATNLSADMSTLVTGPVINDLRQAFQIQRLLERDARGGTRYTEIVLSHFKVKSPDARLQRAEYLGGGTTPVTINPIVQNSASNTQPTPQGNLAGMGTISAGGHGFVKSFTEHGVLIGIINVRADLTYQQGQERMWSRSTRYDFYWPALAHIGEQAVLNKEIYAKGDSNDPLVFGYQERYAEYRYKPSRICGLYRSTASGTVDLWHLSEKFTSLPALNQTFIEDQTSTILQRVQAVNTEPDFFCDLWFRLTCARPMPVYGVPGLIDHF